MQFETKIINGKPSIFFSNDPKNIALKKVSTKDKQLTKKIRESLEINGELDDVKPSPRSQSKNKTNTTKQQPQKSQKKVDSSAITLDQNQLVKIINAIQSNGAQVTIDKSGKIKLLDTSSRQEENQAGDSGDEYMPHIHRNKRNKSVSTEDLTKYEVNDDIAMYHGPKIVTNIEPEDEKPKNLKSKVGENSASKKESNSLIDKKKQKWQEEKNQMEKLSEQELNDRRRLVNNQTKQNGSNDRLSVLPRSGHTPEPVRVPLSLAEKKRIQWQKEIEEMSNSYRETKSRFSSYYNDYYLRTGPVAPYNYSNKERDRMPKERPLSSQMQKSFSLSNLNAEPEYQQQKTKENEKTLSKFNIDSDRKTNLVDKKKQKWSSELNEQANNWNPFGRSVGGPQNKTQVQMNERMPSFNDHSKIPAAMRTSVMFGDVMFEDDIRKTKEIERKRWLQELEAQRRDKVIQNEMVREKEKLTDRSPPPAQQARNYQHSQQSNQDENKVSYARATNKLLDPAQIEDMERRKKANLQHKREIEAQIAEKKRLKNLEDELTNLEDLKAENEAKLMNLNALKEVEKRKQLYDSKPTATNNEFDNGQSIVDQMHDSRAKQKQQQSTTETDDIQKKILQAEYDAALEKHKKLLKKLQHGGHNTDKLVAKFNEFRAKCLAMGVTVGPVIGEEAKQAEKKASKGPPAFNPYKTLSNRNKENQSVMKDEAINTIESSMIKDFGVQTDQTRMKQIFNILREDTNGLPAEITEEQIKLLLKNVSIVDSKTKVLKSNNPKNESAKKTISQKQSVPAKANKPMSVKEKPLWNARKPDAKVNYVKNSEKDPFYRERLAYQEEKRNEQMNQLKALIEQNNAKIAASSAKNYKEQYQNQNDDDSMDHFELPPQVQRQTQMSNRSVNITRQEPKGESILNLIPKNGATKTIKTLYEVDEEELNEIKQKGTSRHNQSKHNYNDRDSDSSLSFVPFMRTNEFLNPAHAASPVPPSRESTATKQERDKARQAFYQNMKPGDYGKYHEDERTRQNDPLMNKNVPSGHSNQRQEHILSQLANLKQSLIQKQKEVASSIQYDEDY